MFGARGVARLVPPNRFKERLVRPNSVKSIKRVRLKFWKEIGFNKNLPVKHHLSLPLHQCSRFFYTFFRGNKPIVGKDH